jgi:endoglucanase
VLAQAAKSRLRVVLDLHNYGRFASPAGVLTLGSPALPATDLADLWRRLARALGSSPALSGYGLMNEPHDLPGGAPAWERASQLTVAAVRAVDRTTPILVAGYSYSSAARWPSVHPRPWINPRSGPVLYEAHQYFDRDGSGTYRDSYQAENARARGQHWQRCG